MEGRWAAADPNSKPQSAAATWTTISPMSVRPVVARRLVWQICDGA